MVSAHGTLDGLTLFAPHLFPLHLLAGVIAICVERDAESEANLHEKVVIE